jgi:glycerol-3-phosphate acyltransferase PlsY
MTTALFAVVGWICGSMPWGYWLVRLFRGEDIRTQGSGNIGATNVWRVHGRRLGLAAVLLDTAKGFVPALVATRVVGHDAGVLAGAAAAAVLVLHRANIRRLLRGEEPRFTRKRRENDGGPAGAGPSSLDAVGEP